MGLRRERLAALLEVNAKTDPAHAAEMLKTAQIMRARAKWAMAKGLRGLTFRGPPN